MAKFPAYLEVDYTFHPTENDKTGCDGLYINSVHVKWWGWPIIFIQWLLRGRQ